MCDGGLADHFFRHNARWDVGAVERHADGAFIRALATMAGANTAVVGGENDQPIFLVVIRSSAQCC